MSIAIAANVWQAGAVRIVALPFIKPLTKIYCTNAASFFAYSKNTKSRFSAQLVSKKLVFCPHCAIDCCYVLPWQVLVTLWFWLPDWCVRPASAGSMVDTSSDKGRCASEIIFCVSVGLYAFLCIACVRLPKK